MDEKNINISKSEEELLEIMENRSHITAGQLHNLEEDEECLQACSDLAEIVIEMQKEQNLLAIDVRKELADFRNKHSKNDRRKNTRILWASVTGVAAAVAIILVLRAMMISSQPEIIKVFQANHIAQEVTLQVNDEKEIKPLKEVVESLSSYSTAQLSSKEIDYSRALLQTETKEVGKQKVQIHRLSIPRGETFKVVLSEGTEVFLNSDSRLAYPTVFKGKERVVSLEGEAYFKVAKDAAHPFIVKSGNLQVRVLGTEFNVSAYPEEEEVTATLISGKVLVEYNGLKEQEILKPNEQLAYNKHTRLGSVTYPDMQDVTAWQRGEIVFRSMTMEEIFTRLERKYPYTFVYSFHSLKSDRFNLTFGQNASIEEVMDIIARVTGNLDYKIVGDKCYLTVRHK